ncbi:MAG: phospholipid/cholesterol/gamma-HCH transport system permease protein [Solirubrobacteraceae bacterium]|jgi:phospholipid/cholesterol/gamma-HCH transport system permease protein|nr:phospholipid/cholesterol/gamma-HCH transport system permease protein [Solirubrobacteraceae bacterium]
MATATPDKQKEEKEQKERAEAPSFLSPMAELGDIAGFSGRAIVYSPGALKYFAEVLRQTSLLITGSSLVLLGMMVVIGGECALFFIYLTRPLGGTDFTGFFEVPCGIREVFPYMFGYVFSAKVGCGLVAEIGSMRISDEIDALESVGMDPMRYVVGTRLLAVVFFVPLIYICCILTGLIGGWLVSVLQIGELTGSRYFNGYWTSQGLIDNLVSLLKITTMGVGIALVGMYYGYKARGGPVGVGNAVARSMFLNMILVHVVGAFWSQVFYSRGAGFPFGG